MTLNAIWWYLKTIFCAIYIFKIHLHKLKILLDMEIIGIEKMTYENILLEIEKFLDRTNNLANDYSSKKINNWIDNQEVCQC